MLNYLGRRFATSGVIVLGISLLALLLLPRCWLGHVGFHERWGRRLLLLQFLDAFLGHCQSLMQRLIFGLHRAHLCQQLALPFLCLTQLLHHLAESLHELAELLFQLCDFFFLRHALSLSERFFLNNIILSNQVIAFRLRYVTWVTTPSHSQ